MSPYCMRLAIMMRMGGFQPCGPNGQCIPLTHRITPSTVDCPGVAHMHGQAQSRLCGRIPRCMSTSTSSHVGLNHLSIQLRSVVHGRVVARLQINGVGWML